MMAMPSLPRCSLIKLRASAAPSSSSDASGSSRIQSFARKASKRQPPSLSGRKQTCRQVLLLAQSHAFQNRLRLVFAYGAPGNAARNAQILNRVQLVLNTILVSDVCDRGKIFLAEAAYVCSIPANLARVRRQQSTNNSQQAGLAASICPERLQKSSGAQRKVQPAKQPALAARATEVQSFQH